MCVQGFHEALEKGRLSGNTVCGVRFVLQDGAAHSVDSSELAFRLAALGAFREVYAKTKPVILEPIMTVEVIAPSEFQSVYLLLCLVLFAHCACRRCHRWFEFPSRDYCR